MFKFSVREWFAVVGGSVVFFAGAVIGGVLYMFAKETRNVSLEKI